LIWLARSGKEFFEWFKDKISQKKLFKKKRVTTAEVQYIIPIQGVYHAGRAVQEIYSYTELAAPL
jgi:hypothetical protein